MKKTGGLSSFFHDSREISSTLYVMVDKIKMSFK